MQELDFILNRVLPELSAGALISLKLILPSALLGFLGGVLVGTLRVFAPKPVRRLFDAYTAVLRGVPLVMQLMFIYFGLPHLGVVMSSFSSAVLGFVLCSSAYHSEYIRGALLSIRQGQLKAAQALGFNTMHMLRSIIIPQALRRALPGCGNEIIYLIKYSSLAYVITCIELTGTAKKLAANTFRFTEVFMFTGVYYLLFTTLATWFLHWLEKKSYIPGFGHKE